MTRSLMLAAIVIAPCMSAVSRGEDGPGRYLFHDATVVLLDGTELRGLCAGITRDSFRLWQPGMIRGFTFTQIRSLMVCREGHPASGALYGLVIGGYAGFLIGGLERENPGYFGGTREFVYAPAGTDAAWTDAALMGFAGGMVGYFIGGGSGSNDRYDLTGPEPSRQRTIDELRGFVSPATAARIHIRLSAGVVSFSGVPSSPAAFLGASAGTRLACFRRGTVTYSLEPWIEVGLGFVDFSEPGVTSETWSAQGYALSEQSSENLLFCAITRTSPLRSVLPGWVSVDLGAGLGVAGIDWRVETPAPWIGWGSTTSTPSRESNPKSLGMTVFGGLTLYPDDHLSIGFAVDYTGPPFLTLPAVPDFGMAARTPGNACVGFELGLQF